MNGFVLLILSVFIVPGKSSLSLIVNKQMALICLIFVTCKTLDRKVLFLNWLQRHFYSFKHFR